MTRSRRWLVGAAATALVTCLGACSSSGSASGASTAGAGSGPGAGASPGSAAGTPGTGPGGLRTGGAGSATGTPGSHGEGVAVATGGARSLATIPAGSTNTTPLTISGYSYTEASTSTTNRLKPLQAQYKQFMTTGTTRGVLGGGRRIGDLTIYALDPTFSVSEVFRSQVASGFAGQVAGSGSKVSTKVVNGVPVQVAQGSVGVMAWYQRGCLVAVVGAKDLSRVTPFVQRYVTGT